MVTRIEALADAISRYTGYYDPDSEVYQARNPGALPAISSKHPQDAKGRRVFRSVMDGYQALLFDLAVKCSGRSKTRLKPESTLRDLILAYGNPESATKPVVKFLRRALHDNDLSEQTSLGYFLEA